jgi:protein MpaA
MQALVQYLQANGNTIPGDTRVVVVPNTNPDGIAAGSRNNSRNVNVDRNFPTANWSASIETASGTLPTGGGTSPGSEPEAAALIALVRQLKPRLSVSYHAQGRLVGANKFADSVTIGDVYSSTVGYKTMYYNAEAVMGYPMTGEFEDWMGEEMNIPAILIELPTASGNYLNAQLPAIKKMFTL